MSRILLIEDESTKAERTTKGTLLQYDLALAGAPVAELSLLPDGKPVPATPEKK